MTQNTPFLLFLYLSFYKSEKKTEGLGVKGVICRKFNEQIRVIPVVDPMPSR